MRPRIARPLFAFVLFAALFGGACATALVPVKLAAQDQPKPVPPAPVPGGYEDLRPAGDDALFAALPAEGLFQGQKPEAARKVVLIDVPLEDSWNDEPVSDLPAAARTAAVGLRMMLEQRLDYLPGVYQYVPQIDPNEYLARVLRHQAALRFSDVPRPGQAVAPGQASQALETVCRRFGADFVIALSYARSGAEVGPARALATRYGRGRGILTTAQLDLAKPDKTSLVSLLNDVAATLCAGIATRGTGPDVQPEPAAPVPPLAADDTALQLLVQMRRLLEQGELTQAWVKYEDLKRRDPANGRAALLAMEIFRGFAEQQTDAAERAVYLARVLQTGREGLKAAPNDVILRGKLCRLASIWFKRDAWCLEGLQQALVVQPANPHLLDWHVTIEHALDRARQAAWLESVALPLAGAGCGSYLVGTAYFAAGQYAPAVAWYRKAVAASPQEHEFAFSLGLAATYLGESLQKTAPSAEATIEAFATAAEALVAAQRIDPTVMGWPFEFHVRAQTRSFRQLPANPDDLERLLLSQAVVNGLQPTSKTAVWDRLVDPVIKTQRRLLRESARAADPKGPDYEVWLMARLQFALVDNDRQGAVDTLRIMRRIGHRSNLYTAMAGQFAAAMDAPEKKQD